MDWSWLTGFLSEVAYLLITFALVYTWATVRGYWAVVRLIVGLYLALVLFLHLPFIDTILSPFDQPLMRALTQVIIFAGLAGFAVRLCVRLIPDEGRERYFANVPKKLVLSIGATVLIMSISFQILPVTDIIFAAGTPLQTLFAPPSSFFWWLVVPLAVLFFV